jgi:hypothetical protein
MITTGTRRTNAMRRVKILAIPGMSCTSSGREKRYTARIMKTLTDAILHLSKSMK